MSDGRRGRGIAAAGGGRAVSVFGVSETHSSHIRRGGTLLAARTSRLSDHFRPPRPAVPGVRGFLSADFMLSELSLCRMGRPWSAWDRAARFASLPEFAPPHVPRNRRPEIGSPKRSEAERFSPFRKRDRASPQTRSTNIRVKDDQSTLRAHAIDRSPRHRAAHLRERRTPRQPCRRRPGGAKI